jgi:hypothetical protein
MLMGLFRAVLTIALLLRFGAVAQAPQQTVKQGSASLAINPPEVTLHVGDMQTFEVMVKGTQTSEIRWAVKEPDGGRVSKDGTYTAPRHIGLYHVVATSVHDPTAKAVAKVTVVTEIDPNNN